MSTQPRALVLQSAHLPRRGRAKAFVRVARRKYLGTASAFVLVVLVFSAVFAGTLAPYDPIEPEPSIALQAPTFSHWLGTDELGRDLFSRILLGARISLLVGVSAVTMGVVIGVTLGLTSAYFGGRYDLVVQRFIDSAQAFPSLILVIAIVATLGQSLFNVILAIGINTFAGKTRVVRGTALSVMQNTYIESARAIGCSGMRMMLIHILPNCWAPIIVITSLSVGTAIIAESSLSFLGLGPPPPDPTWGSMLSGPARNFMRVAPWLALAPGIAITAVVLAFNLLGDAIRDILDPRLRGTE